MRWSFGSANLLNSFDSEYLIIFCTQSGTGLLSRLILAEFPFLAGWVYGFATWQKPPEDDWPTPSCWQEDLAGVIPNGCESCQSAGSTKLWSSAGLRLKLSLCITHYPKKASHWLWVPFLPWNILDLGEGKYFFFVPVSFSRDFFPNVLAGIFLLFK